MSEPLAIYGSDLFGEVIQPPSRGPIADAFLVPPFSVLNAREGFWQDRKRAWMAMGIKGELGRDAVDYGIGDKATWDATTRQAGESKTSRSRKLAPGGGGGGCWLGGPQTNSSAAFGNNTQCAGQGTSIFDPVLCELAYRWFCPPSGQIVDPFAGGSVRGIVASVLGMKYWGCDLSARQIEANIEQGQEICPDEMPQWITGDAMDALESAPDADFLFSCPPYGDLEVYSDDPCDISNMEYHTFLAAYKRIILRACKKLKQDRFACFVVGDFRDKRTGNYRDFVSATISAFKEQGLELYNEAILVTSVGSLPIRIRKQFESGRKLGKTHQNVLVFVKGDGKKAATKIEGV